MANIDVVERKDGKQQSISDVVIEEMPIALVYNGISHAVMMATPSDFKDFAVGFSISEGIVNSVNEITDFSVEQTHIGIELKMTISSRRFAELKEKRRTLAGSSGCGLCGVDSLVQANKKVGKLKPQNVPSAHAIEQAVAQLLNWQELNQQCGGVHGAAWCNFNGEILLVREDVGRHNALDKLIGALRLQEFSTNQGFVLASSRASYEMAYKTVTAGIGHLITISAATSKAIDLAQQANLNLVGFARDNRHIIYHQVVAQSKP